ncbi:hypothetical protein VA596_37495 [Amycolatopsis sp., V23-08]|uniref:Uncharacterized protein n=1 Tax=Amycolatopsis heterodermiae TaxID=3110235 RepID=A0ABU5RI63_9PSEU|nr:hypothetical protein [Amycolatopsis sp., V23-08]MEA5365274.1 hypothetical protein [Amycolatopsis sp., V23-08]
MRTATAGSAPAPRESVLDHLRGRLRQRHLSTTTLKDETGACSDTAHLIQVVSTAEPPDSAGTISRWPADRP